MIDNKRGADGPRVSEIYEGLTGKSSAPGQWRPEIRQIALDIVNVEDTCKSMLESIDQITKAKNFQSQQLQQALYALRSDFRSLVSLANDRRLAGSFKFLEDHQRFPR